jgi:hypothetical protein
MSFHKPKADRPVTVTRVTQPVIIEVSLFGSSIFHSILFCPFTAGACNLYSLTLGLSDKGQPLVFS